MDGGRTINNAGSPGPIYGAADHEANAGSEADLESYSASFLDGESDREGLGLEMDSGGVRREPLGWDPS